MLTLNKKRVLSDVILIVALIAVAFAAYLIIDAQKETGDYVIVSVNGDDFAEYSLSENGEYSIADGKNILVIEDGNAYMKSADCPDKTCVRTGKISQTGERITCLPNMVVVVVKGSGEEIFESK